MIFGGSLLYLEQFTKLLAGDTMVINRMDGRIEFRRNGELLKPSPDLLATFVPVASIKTEGEPDLPVGLPCPETFKLDKPVTVPTVVLFVKFIAGLCGFVASEQESDGMFSRFIFHQVETHNSPCAIAPRPAGSSMCVAPYRGEDGR